MKLEQAQRNWMKVNAKIKALLEKQEEGLATDVDWILLKPEMRMADSNLLEATQDYLQRKGLWDKKLAQSWLRLEQRGKIAPMLKLGMTLQDRPWHGVRVVTHRRQNVKAEREGA